MSDRILIQEAKSISLNEQDEIDQILGHPPSWLLRWGLSLLFVTAIIFAALAWLIKYPDIISTEVQILTENPAIRIIPMANGKITEFFVENQQLVEEGTLLAVLESPIERVDIIHLVDLLEKIEKVQQPKDYLNIQFSDNLYLGNMQILYADLVQKIKHYQHYLVQTNQQRKNKILVNQIEHQLSINETIKKQQQTLEKELVLAKKNFSRNQKLKEEGVISDLDLEQTEAVYLQYQRQLDNFEMQIFNNKMQIEQLQTQIIDLQQNHLDRKSEQIITIQEIIQTLKSQIDNWKQTYLITAPIAGKVSLNNIWSVNQYAKAGEELFTLVPTEGAGEIIAKALLPAANSGKVAVGQVVNIRLTSYPYQEYGIIKSSVKQISLIPKKDHYLIELVMPSTLKTSYNRIIPFTQEMKGVADIITEDRRILERIFDRVWNLLKNA